MQGDRGTRCACVPPSPSWISDETLDDADADQADAQDTRNQEQGRRHDHVTTGASPIDTRLQNSGSTFQESGQSGGSSLKNTFFLKFVYINDTQRS